MPVPGGYLLAVIDEPADGSKGDVVCCHDLPADRVGDGRFLVDFAASLAVSGYRCLRFDHRGSGESSGEFRDMTFATMREDLQHVIAWRPQGHERLVLAGQSIGAVAPALACADEGAAAVALLSADLMEGMRFLVEGEVALRGGEFHMPASTFRAREQMKPLTAVSSSQVPTRLFYREGEAKVEAALEWFEEFEVPADCLAADADGQAYAMAVVAWLDTLWM